MPTFAIIARDKPGGVPLRAQTRPLHLDHLRTLGDHIIRAGPLDDETGQPVGSLILATFDSLADAEAFAAADPYAAVGLFDTIEVIAWRPVFP